MTAPADVIRMPAAAARLPRWLRTRPRRRVVREKLTPRQPRWWVGVGVLFVSALLLGFVGHVMLFGVLQHARSNAMGYADLRSSLAQATTPVGQLDLKGRLVSPGTPIALIGIPSLGLAEVVREGTTSDVTRQGVGHRRDSVIPGQAGLSVLYGRQAAYGGPFSGISRLAPGDAITVTTGQGTQKFAVIGVRRPGDRLPAKLGADRSRLELVTAGGIPLASDSVIYVDADLVGKARETPSAVLLTQAIAPGEAPMQSDPNAALTFLFALQWLLIAAVAARWLVVAWGRWQAWIIAVPVLLVLGATVADCAAALLPNLS